MKDYRAVPAGNAEILQKGEAKMYCPVCGMTLPAFYRTNHAADINGKTHQYCSAHCVYEHAHQAGTTPKNIKVVDNTTLKFIPADKAFYVVGSTKPATMAMVSKYAFGTKEAADKFAEEFGGDVLNYKDVEMIVKKDLKKDMMMIKKRQAKAAKMGEKTYKKMCKQTDKRFASPAEAKAYIKANRLCGNLKGKPEQQVALYLSSRGK